jgi:hypothetical protein
MITGKEYNSTLILVLLPIIFGNLNGVLNAFVYGFTRKVKRHLRKTFCPKKNKTSRVTDTTKDELTTSQSKI